MSRGTVRRVWTPLEIAQAAQIVEFVSTYRAGRYPAGALAIARHLHLTKAKVYDLMPLAVIQSVATHPGQVLIPVPDRGGALYQMVSDASVSGPVMRTRTRRVDTMLRRLAAEAEPYRDRTDLAAVTICAHYDRLLTEVDSLGVTLDAIEASL